LIFVINEALDDEELLPKFGLDGAAAVFGMDPIC